MSKEIAAVWEDIDRLVPWDQNPRHNKSAIQSVADSIKRFGFGAPIVAREQDKMVIAGHTRLEAARLLGLDRVPVRYLDLDPADAKMLALADNKIGEIAEWNEEVLASIIDELSLSVDDMQDIGWSKEEIDGLFDPVFDSIEEPKPKESAIDIENLSTEVLHGDCMQRLKEIPTASIDAIVTDPPYGLSPDGKCRTWADIEEGSKLSGFMGKEWDAAVPCHNFFSECLRVLKPGGHLIAFSSTRTVFALGMACQKGGFELRDQIFWCYFSGFPKSHDISKAIDKEAGAVREVIPNPLAKKQTASTNTIVYGDYSSVDGISPKPATKEAERWNGFGTALKPAVEPALLARKPLEDGLTIAQNVLKYGTGALNIDECRFGYGDPCWVGPQEKHKGYPNSIGGNQCFENLKDNPKQNKYFESSWEMPQEGRWPANLYQCAKPSTKEREQGLDHLQSKSAPNNLSGGTDSRLDGNPVPMRANFHPTVKPLKLMRWCCRLIGGQKGSVILDPFGGSGTTGAAAILEGFDCILIEREADYLPIIDARLKWAKNNQGDADG